MKFVIIIFISTLMQVSAAGLAQTVTLNENNSSLERIFRKIRSQTGYDFVYDSRFIDKNVKINLKLDRVNLDAAMISILKGQNLSFVIKDNIIVLDKSASSSTNFPVSSVNVIVVRGRVLDENGQPLPGATIKISGEDRTASTDSEGFFVLKDVASGAMLEISFVGYRTKIIQAIEDVKSISLEISNNKLQEVTISTGYQTLNREKLTGAAVTVTAQDLEKRYTPNILDNLEGRIPGLVTYKGNVTVRGLSTFNSASRSPLYVVDGLPIEGSVANINPYDVETITVLKDAAAAAIYGVRASNGVIVITTKKAKQNGTTIEFATDVTLSDKLDYSKFNYLTPSQQVDIDNASSEWQYSNPTTGPAAIAQTKNLIDQGIPISPINYLHYQLAQNQITRDQLNSNLEIFRKNNFLKEFEDHALLNQVLQQYNLAIRNNAEKFQSSLLVNYKSNNSGIIKAFNKQLNLFYKGSYRPYNWINIDFGVNQILGKIKESNSSFATMGNNMAPYVRLLDDSGNRLQYTNSDYNPYNTINSNTIPQLQSMLVNHLDELDRDSRQTRQNFGRYFINLKANILPGLTFSPQFQYENNATSLRAYSEADSYTMRYLRNVFTTRAGTDPDFTYNYLIPAGGKLATSQETTDSWTGRAQVDYNKKLDKHEIVLLVGTEFRESLTKGTRGLLLGYDDQLQSQNTANVNFPAIRAYTRSNFFKPNFGTANLINDLTDQIGLIPEIRQRSNSVYANATYTYDNKYNVFGSYRKDYADVFGLDEKYRGRPLWSAGLGWNLHNEDFLKVFSWVNFLKVRATYGVTGNIPPGLSSLLVANSSLPPNPVTQLPVSVVESSENPKLTWEKTTTANIGIDFAFLDGRLSGALDWYHKKGNKIFSATRIDPSEGFTSQIINNGDLLNKGIELNLQYQWFRPSNTNHFGWLTNMVLSKNTNKIIYVDQIANTPQSLTEGGLKVGYPIQSLFSYRHGGMSAEGQPQWYKANGTLTTTALTADDFPAIVYSGGADPKLNMTLINEVNYKGFSLNILAVYYAGHYQRVPMYATSGSANIPLPSYTLNAWTPSNPNTYVLGIGEYMPKQGILTGQLSNSDVFVQHSDFVKIRSVGIAYQFPKNVLARLGSRNVSLRFQLNNPKALWIKNKVNIDPETGGAPVLTSYVFGLNFNL